MNIKAMSLLYQVLIVTVVLGFATGAIPNPFIHDRAQASPAYAPVTLNDPTPQVAVVFGGAVARVGDVDGDGVPDLLVGARSQSVGANTSQGQAFLFVSPRSGQFAVFDP